MISGLVGTEPVEKDSSLSLQISNIQFPISNNQLGGKILLTVPKYYAVAYGDQVQFNAKLALPSVYDTFDYKGYLARYGVHSIAKNVDEFQIIANYINSNELSLMERGTFFVVANLIKIKNYFCSTINKTLPEPHAALMLGILLGAKTSLPEWLLKIFQIIGITHIIAISGYNITILAKVADKTLGKIGRRYIFWGVVAMILSFVVMTGASASVVRAGVMGALLVYAGFIGRKSNITNALVFAGTIMILLNPLILKNDIGFQLSFLATLGLVYISPIFEKWLIKIPEFFRVLLSATLSAQVLTLPILISSFGLVSLISPVSNTIILPFIPVSMFLGFASGLAGMIWLPLGKLIGFFSYIILETIIKLSQLLASIPYASVTLKINNWWVLAVYYLVISVLVLVWHKRNKIKKEI